MAPDTSLRKRKSVSSNTEASDEEGIDGLLNAVLSADEASDDDSAAASEGDLSEDDDEESGFEDDGLQSDDIPSDEEEVDALKSLTLGSNGDAGLQDDEADRPNYHITTDANGGER